MATDETGARITDAAGTAAPPAVMRPGQVGTARLRRVGILGGTFDPIHAGHLAVARHARDALGLDEVVLMPNGLPAWKLGQGVAPAHDRWAMCWLAARGEPWLSVSRMEVDRPGVTLTVDTVRRLAEAVPDGTEAWLVAGADSVAEMPTWKGIGEIARAIRVAAVPRPGQDLAAIRVAIDACGEPLDVTWLDVPPTPDISSTLVRRLVAGGADVTGLVGPDVAAYIRDAGLYAPGWSAPGPREAPRADILVGHDCVGVGVGAAIVRDGRVLMLRRARIPEAGMWDLPGGKVELGEGMADALAREVMEEVGLEVTSCELVAVSDHIVPRDEMHFVVLAFRAEADGEPRNMEPHKHTEMAWFPLGALPGDMTVTARGALGRL